MKPRLKKEQSKTGGKSLLSLSDKISDIENPGEKLQVRDVGKTESADFSDSFDHRPSSLSSVHPVMMFSRQEVCMLQRPDNTAKRLPPVLIEESYCGTSETAALKNFKLVFADETSWEEAEENGKSSNSPGKLSVKEILRQSRKKRKSQLSVLRGSSLSNGPERQTLSAVAMRFPCQLNKIDLLNCENAQNTNQPSETDLLNPKATQNTNQPNETDLLNPKATQNTNQPSKTDLLNPKATQNTNQPSKTDLLNPKATQNTNQPSKTDLLNGQTVHQLNKTNMFNQGAVRNAGQPNNHPCRICGKLFTSLFLLRTHILRNHKEDGRLNLVTDGLQFVCTLCKTSYESLASLEAHLKKHRAGNYHRICEICGKAYPTLRYLRRHQMSHSDHKHYQCEQCGRRFKQWKSLHVHRLTHQGFKRECKVCGKMLSSEEGIKGHMRSHQGPPPFQCEVCGKGYFLLSNLRAHFKKAHGDRWTDQKTGETPISLTILEARWRLFGHILRQAINTPPNVAMTKYFKTEGSKQRGRPKTSIVTTLRRDLKSHNNDHWPTRLHSITDLDHLRNIAQNRSDWKHLTTAIYRSAQAETSIDVAADGH
ncbi:zinc finger protein 408 [Elysia marginata]|uniref:Zinc finger protein 408 n=1 Tax=Elysia marginata TaxID=1093978 RepID=A0AAV4HY31_9GAST|nr:zinc finger protein 408 [Elysia marginata]